MTWQHFRALVWLRRRLFRNRMRKAGKVNAVLTRIFMVLAVVLSVGLFFTALTLGIWLLPKASPDHLLYLWTAITVAFLFFWMMGVMTELQRSEVLSIEKLFHFPISPSSAFVINYLSSLVTLSLILFFPAMLGLAIASVVALGPWMLLTLPLLVAFLLMVTAITYQFRGWLATLMVNKRRRRTIVAVVTAAFILISQSGNFINLFFQGRRWQGRDDTTKQFTTDLGQLQNQFNQHKITAEEYKERFDSLNQERHRKDEQETQEFLGKAKQWVSLADLILPPGWLAYGTFGAAQHELWPGVVGTVLLCAIAGASLRRSYHTTIRFYLGDYRSDRSTADGVRSPAIIAPAAVEKTTGELPAGATAAPVLATAPSAGMVGKSLPWVPDQAAATGLATLRSLLRAPEVKMMLLTPIIIGGVVMTGRLAGRGGAGAVPVTFRPMIALGIVTTIVVSLSQLFQNQFGFDRSAFRMFVLCPAPRWQILLGKNLALAPIVAIAGAIFLGIMEFLFPLRPTDFLATFVELLTAYLIGCLVGNQISILLPAAVKQGSMRSSSDTKILRVLARLAAMLGQLVAFVPLVLPLGIDYLVQQFPWGEWIPAYLIFSLLVALVTLFVYRIVLDYQGGLLQRRELLILEAVTTKDD
jgi:ABC-2 type transport system permease protein